PSRKCAAARFWTGLCTPHQHETRSALWPLRVSRFEFCVLPFVFRAVAEPLTQFADGLVLLIADAFGADVELLGDFLNGPAFQAEAHDLLLAGREDLGG